MPKISGTSSNAILTPEDDVYAQLVDCWKWLDLRATRVIGRGKCVYSDPRPMVPTAVAQTLAKHAGRGVFQQAAHEVAKKSAAMPFEVNPDAERSCGHRSHLVPASLLWTTTALRLYSSDPSPPAEGDRVSLPDLLSLCRSLRQLCEEHVVSQNYNYCCCGWMPGDQEPSMTFLRLHVFEFFDCALLALARVDSAEAGQALHMALDPLLMLSASVCARFSINFLTRLVEATPRSLSSVLRWMESTVVSLSKSLEAFLARFYPGDWKDPLDIAAPLANRPSPLCAVDKTRVPLYCGFVYAATMEYVQELAMRDVGHLRTIAEACPGLFTWRALTTAQACLLSLCGDLGKVLTHPYCFLVRVMYTAISALDRTIAIINDLPEVTAGKTLYRAARQAQREELLSLAPYPHVTPQRFAIAAGLYLNEYALHNGRFENAVFSDNQAERQQSMAEMVRGALFLGALHPLDFLALPEKLEMIMWPEGEWREDPTVPLGNRFVVDPLGPPCCTAQVVFHVLMIDPKFRLLILKLMRGEDQDRRAIAERHLTRVPSPDLTAEVIISVGARILKAAPIARELYNRYLHASQYSAIGPEFSTFPSIVFAGFCHLDLTYPQIKRTAASHEALHLHFVSVLEHTLRKAENREKVNGFQASLAIDTADLASVLSMLNACFNYDTFGSRMKELSAVLDRPLDRLDHPSFSDQPFGRPMDRAFMHRNPVSVLDPLGPFLKRATDGALPLLVKLVSEPRLSRLLAEGGSYFLSILADTLLILNRIYAKVCRLLTADLFLMRKAILESTQRTKAPKYRPLFNAVLESNRVTLHELRDVYRSQLKRFKATKADVGKGFAHLKAAMEGVEERDWLRGVHVDGPGALSVEGHVNKAWKATLRKGMDLKRRAGYIELEPGSSPGSSTRGGPVSVEIGPMPGQGQAQAREGVVSAGGTSREGSGSGAASTDAPKARKKKAAGGFNFAKALGGL